MIRKEKKEGAREGELIIEKRRKKKQKGTKKEGKRREEGLKDGKVKNIGSKI